MYTSMIRIGGLLMLAAMSQLMLGSDAASIETPASLAPNTTSEDSDAVLKNQSASSTAPDTDQKISQLETEKAELLEKIKESLSEAAKDPSAAALAQEITSRLNGSWSVNDSFEDRSDPSSTLLSGRRNENHKKKANKQDSMFDIETLYSKKDRQSNNWKNRMANKAIIQSKLDAWLKDRMAEKAKIKAYKNKQKAKSLYNEKCPNNGFQKAKKTDSNRNRPSDSRGHKYPCCRKCCKKSYMGCL